MASRPVRRSSHSIDEPLESPAARPSTTSVTLARSEELGHRVRVIAGAEHHHRGRQSVGIVIVVDEDLAPTVVVDEDRRLARHRDRRELVSHADTRQPRLAHRSPIGPVSLRRQSRATRARPRRPCPRPRSLARKGCAQHQDRRSRAPLPSHRHETSPPSRPRRPFDVKPRSRDVTDGMQKAASRAMLRAVGMTDDDWDKPQVAIASSWNEVTPCNMTLRKLAERAKDGRPRARAASRWSSARSPSVRRHLDGSRGHARLARVTRGDHRLGRDRDARRAPRWLRRARRMRQVDPGDADGGGAPRPGQRIRLQRVDPARPARRRQAIDITSVFEAVGACAAGTIDEAELLEVERKACPGEGACGGMFTANTMSSIAEALGMSLPGTASPPAGRRASRSRRPPSRRSGRGDAPARASRRDRS